MTFVARMRKWWWQSIRGYPYEICERCGGPVQVVWAASDNLWKVIIGSEYGIRCILCFTIECAEQGRSLRWKPTVDYVGEPYDYPL